MGLAEPRKRIKISHDPNNLTWSQAKDSFGAKILESQGWKPGQYLGARDAKHSAHYTAGSSSHLKIKIKDDNLGLGAASSGRLAEERSKQVDAFQGLLGRLNGKSDAELKKEEDKGRDVRLAAYAMGKWGGMVFVRGGVLVQGKDFIEGIEALKARENGDKQSKAETKALTAVGIIDSSTSSSEETLEKSKKKTAKSMSKPDSTAVSTAETTPVGSAAEEANSLEESKESRRKRKEEKRLRKEARRLRREQRAKISEPENLSESAAVVTQSELEADTPDPEETTTFKKKDKKKKKRQSEEEQSEPHPSKRPKTQSQQNTAPISTSNSPSPRATTIPIPIPTPTPPLLQQQQRTGRHLLRAKNIKSKRMAFEGVGGLDGIFGRIGV